jgi:hypothetical protein
MQSAAMLESLSFTLLITLHFAQHLSRLPPPPSFNFSTQWFAVEIRLQRTVAVSTDVSQETARQAMHELTQSSSEACIGWFLGGNVFRCGYCGRYWTV